MEKDFNTYLANLAIWNAKLHNIHWNVVGMQFVPVHEFTEAEYDKAFERFDEVAEHFKMYGYTPVSTLKEYLELATIKEIEPKAFSCKEAIEIVLADMELMRDMATKLRNDSDEQGWFSAVSIFEDHVNDYNKQIWFMKSMLA